MHQFGRHGARLLDPLIAPCCPCCPDQVPSWRLAAAAVAAAVVATVAAAVVGAVVAALAAALAAPALSFVASGLHLLRQLFLHPLCELCRQSILRRLKLQLAFGQQWRC